MQTRHQSAVIAFATAMGLCLTLAQVHAQTAELNDRTTLRVCADPSHLPYSNDKQEGFENKIINVLGAELGLPVVYTWFPQGPGFVKSTLGLRRCDLVPGVSAGDDTMTTTTPYYFTTYVMISSKSGPTYAGLSDPALQGKRVGVTANSPPVNLMLKYHLMTKMHSYAQVFDTRFDSPDHELVKDVVSGETDVGLIWGPMGGYWIKHDNLPLTIQPIKAEEGSFPMTFHIAMGVRGSEPEWRRKVGAALTKHKAEIDAILFDYGVPLLDEQGNLMTPPGAKPAP
jgi:quinoprotein dehydrogenase-associated probable ABC transporter substrate-binding protein